MTEVAHFPFDNIGIQIGIVDCGHGFDGIGYVDETGRVVRIEINGMSAVTIRKWMPVKLKVPPASQSVMTWEEELALRLAEQIERTCADESQGALALWREEQRPPVLCPICHAPD